MTRTFTTYLCSEFSMIFFPAASPDDILLLSLMLSKLTVSFVQWYP